MCTTIATILFTILFAILSAAVLMHFRELESKYGIHCNLTFLFNFVQVGQKVYTVAG